MQARESARTPFVLYAYVFKISPKKAVSFHPHRQDFLPSNFYLNPQWRPQIRALHDRSPRQQVSGKRSIFEGIVHRTAAGIADHRMARAPKTIIGLQFRQVRDIFELAAAIG